MAKTYPTRSDLTAEYLRRILDYDPETGHFTWRHRIEFDARWNNRFAGKRAGNLRRVDGQPAYWIICINARKYRAHRLAWLWVKGEWPVGELDHEDGDGLNNRIGNLRLASSSQNKGNTRTRADNSTGFKSVNKMKNGRFRAYIKQRHIGVFDTAEEAHAAYVAAAKEEFGEHWRAG